MSSNNDANFVPFVSVHYPGVVNDTSKMLETLGGIRTISSTFSEKNRRLELRFRPDDAFCKPCYGSRKPVNGLLLKIKMKKPKEKTQRVISWEVIGYVSEEYKFGNLCDFQYLPTSSNECLFNSVVPTTLNFEWFDEECSYFLPPAAFSRIDTVQNFNFGRNPVEEDQPNVIGRLKRKRYGCTKCMSFENPEVPTLPKDLPNGAVYSTKIIASETFEQFKLLFQERPIYSKNAIRCISKLPLVQLKCVLPCVAYYFVNGPWRSLWVRFGYDPRKDPSSRIYQTLDYRVRSNFTKEEVKNKRGSAGTSFAYRFSNQGAKSTSVISRSFTEANEKEEKVDDDEYIFRPDMIPPSRQCYYQYCDIHVPEIKAILDKLDPVDENAVCHEIDGWMPPALADTCREIMNRYVSEEVKKRNKMVNQPANSIIVESQGSIFSGSESDFSDSEQF